MGTTAATANGGTGYAWPPHAVAADGLKSAATMRHAHIVVVDDVAANVDLLQRLLRSTGFTNVSGFTDPLTALNHCRSRLPDLLLLDLHMPRLDGVGMLEQLRTLIAPDDFVPTIVLTADIADETRKRVLSAGAKDFLTKPFDRTEVMLRVGNMLETRLLHVRLREHNAVLQAEIDHSLAEERERAAARRELEGRVAAAFEPDALAIVFQPFLDIASNQIVGAEALARFALEPRRPPNEWFHDAAAIGRGRDLELAAVSAALDGLHRLPEDTFLSVNASPDTAASPEFAALLAASGAPTEQLVIEVTEHAPVSCYDKLASNLAPLRASGVRIAIDDAGAGYAGLQHILRLQPDIIKLDIALTSGIDTDPAKRALGTAMVRFGADVSATVLAEGVETEGELQTLRDLGVDWAQGYFLARPAPLPLCRR